MPICVIVLKQNLNPQELTEKLLQTKAALSSCQLVYPNSQDKNKASSVSEFPIKTAEESIKDLLTPCQINNVKLLNPKLAKKERQKTMAFWLMPFGFVAGLSFTQMTGLTTFEDLGLSSWSEPLIGGLLGMISGLIGSFAAAGGNDDEKNKDIQKLRKRNAEGKWLLILETPAGLDLPWEIMQEINPLEIVRLNQL